MLTVGRLAFVADFETQKFYLKTKFDMENKTSTNHENGNDANRLLAVVLSEEEKELIYQQERKKYEGSSWEVELDYHKETFMSGIDALVEYLNNR